MYIKNNDFDQELFSERFKIKTARNQQWDYSSPGYYFITICTISKTNYFGNIENGKMILFDIGKIVKKQLFKTSIIRKNILLDYWVIMPNHVHFIINIVDNINFVETHCNASLQIMHNQQQQTKKYQFNKFGPQINNIPSIIRGFKSAVKHHCNQNGHYSFNWQPRYHDRIIRNEKELITIRQYIQNNPKNWELDRNNRINYL